MSPLVRNDLDAGKLPQYAPLRQRLDFPELRVEQVADDGQGSFAPGGTEQTPVRLAGSSEETPHQQSRMLQGAGYEALGEHLELEPSILSRRIGRDALSAVIIKSALAATAAAVIALLFVTVVPLSRPPVQRGDADGIAPTGQSPRTPSLAAPQRKLVSMLVVNDSSGTVNEPLQLGISVTAPGSGASVTLRGLPPGALLTAGKRIGASEWRIPAQEISTAAVIPPDDFIGQVTIAAELGGDDGGARVGSSVHLTWTPAPTARPIATPQPASPASPVAPSPVVARPEQALALAPSSQAPSPTPSSPTTVAPPMPAVQALDPAEIAAFLNRAQELISAGDWFSARLLLRHATKAQNARAAFVLAQTYDPLVLKQRDPTAPAADVEAARNWYERAREWGAPDAQRQLDALQAIAR
jgi:hypothetical protein